MYRATDPEDVHQILTRRKDFLQAPITIQIMKFLGSNLLTASIQSDFINLASLADPF
jgi:hypothetical protein